jgi:hypothetical protein
MSFRLILVLHFTAILSPGLFCNTALSSSPEAQHTPSEDVRYDEQMLLGGLEVSANQLRAAMKRTGTDRDHPGGTNWQNEPAIINIGWSIIALGEFSGGNDAVKKTLFQIKSEFGFLRVPYWMGSDDRRKAIARFYSFSSGDGVIALRLPGPQLLFSLATQAEKQITQRSGYKFEGYDGPVFNDVD